MPKIRREKLPDRVLVHFLARVRQRSISVQERRDKRLCCFCFAICAFFAVASIAVSKLAAANAAAQGHRLGGASTGTHHSFGCLVEMYLFPAHSAFQEILSSETCTKAAAAVPS